MEDMTLFGNQKTQPNVPFANLCSLDSQQKKTNPYPLPIP